ncbi:hypothetical protein BX616_002189 [Lobosporangium transversale]|nr:hypothetical protein BX616_002189 [Lobosporangium transversale]
MYQHHDLHLSAPALPLAPLSASYLTKRWHPEPPPVLQRPCLVIDKIHGRAYMIGYDSKDRLVFNFMDSTEACDSNKQERYKSEETGDGSEGGFSVWDHGRRTWTHIRINRPCTYHEEEYEKGGKMRMKEDTKRIKFERPARMIVVYQSYREHATHRHRSTNHLDGDNNDQEALDTIVAQWEDRHGRHHLTGVQLVNHMVYSCHDIKIGQVCTLPPNITLVASPNNPYHYTFHNAPKKYKNEGDHGSPCGNTALFLFGPQGSGWFNISIADRPNPRPIDIIYRQHNVDKAIKDGFHPLPDIHIENPRAVYYDDQLWIFGKFDLCIIYGGCDRAENCSTNLRPGERGRIQSVAPVSIYRPGIHDSGDNNNANKSENHGGTSHTGPDDSLNSGGDSDSSGSGDSGSSGGSNGTSNSDSSNSNASSNPDDSNNSDNPSSGDSSNSGTGGSDNSGSGGSDSLGSNNSGNFEGLDEAGNSGSGDSGSGDSGVPADSSSWTPDSGVPAGTASEGVPDVLDPNDPYPNPDTSGQVLVGVTSIPMNTASVTTSDTSVPSVNGFPNNVAKNSDDGSKNHIDIIIGSVLVSLALITLVALIFFVGRKRRSNDSELGEAGSGADQSINGAGIFSSERYVGSAHTQPKQPTGINDMPDLAPVTPSIGDIGLYGLPGLDGPSGTTRPVATVNRHKRKGSVNVHHEPSDVAFFEPSTESDSIPLLRSLQTSSPKPLVGGGDHSLPHQASHTLSAMVPITTTGPKAEVQNYSSNTSKGDLAVRAIGAVSGAGVAALVIRQHSEGLRTQVEGFSSTTTMLTQDETQEVLSGRDMIESSLKHTNTNTIALESSLVIHQDKVKCASSPESVPRITDGKTATISEGMGRKEPSIHKTQITLKLSIVCYERSDAAQATPHAKPGTLLFSQMEMLGNTPEINTLGSAFSHVRDISKTTNQAASGPSGIVLSIESESHRRSLKWMKNESQWKREAGMLQYLKSDQYIAELFTLNSLPAFAEYRYVSVMGPFNYTLESYIKSRKGVHAMHRPPAAPKYTLAQQGPLTLIEIKAMTDSIASAIRRCHDHHIVHLSLTPASVYLQDAYESYGQGYTSSHPSYPNKSVWENKNVSQIQQRWKLWNFSHTRFVGEAVDLNMEMTPYTAPEILVASHHYKKHLAVITAINNKSPNEGTTITTMTKGKVTKTTTTDTTKPITSHDTEKLIANAMMDMWSLGQIVYEMHTTQSMFMTHEDALEKLSSVLERRDEDGDLDKVNAHSKIRQQLEDQIQKIERIPDHGAREVIKGLLEMQHKRRLDHDEIRELYLNIK